MAEKRTKTNWACEKALCTIKGKGRFFLVDLPQPTASVGITFYVLLDTVDEKSEGGTTVKDPSFGERMRVLAVGEAIIDHQSSINDSTR
jgi:hypothetical protein